MCINETYVMQYDLFATVVFSMLPEMSYECIMFSPCDYSMFISFFWIETSLYS